MRKYPDLQHKHLQGRKAGKSAKFGTKQSNKYTVNFDHHQGIQEEIDRILDKINSEGFGYFKSKRKIDPRKSKEFFKEMNLTNSWNMFKLAITVLFLLCHSFTFSNESKENGGVNNLNETDLTTDTLKALVPSEQMVHETRWLIQALEKAHFNKISALDVNATIFLERFLRNLDRQKLFFSQQDLNKYNDRYSSTLITYLSQGNLFPAFEIYSDYRKKAITRLSQVSESKLVSLDLKSDQTYTPQRQDLEWDKDDDNLDKTWISLLTHELITESLVSSDINASEPHLEKDKTESLITAREEISKKYARWKKNILEFEPSDIQELYLSTLTQMFDPHTSFLNVKEKEKFDQNMQNEFVGIGAVLTDNDGYCTIKELLPGGPAEASRSLEPEDVILKVAQGESEFVNVVNMKLSKIVELIKGPENTLVRLEIRSIKDKTITKKVRIIRQRIKAYCKLGLSEHSSSRFQ